MFTNLLDNAAKYTSPGGQVWLSAQRDGREAVVRVRDAGMGIEPAHSEGPRKGCEFLVRLPLFGSTGRQ